MYKDKISGVYKITNNVTGEFYIGSSVNVKKRWAQHKGPSMWKDRSNSKLYQAMQKYGLDCFSFEILEEVEPESLRQTEQKFIELLKPTYNQMNAKGLNVERAKATSRKASMKYIQSEKGREYMREYNQSEKGRKACRKYSRQLCEYNGETLTLNALRIRFRKAGISHPTLEARKYLTNNK